MDVFGDRAQYHTHLQDLLTAPRDAGEPSKQGFRKTGKVPGPLKLREGFGHVTSTSRQKQAHHKTRKSPSSLPITQTLFPR
jgi:hypothetical protein